MVFVGQYVDRQDAAFCEIFVSLGNQTKLAAVNILVFYFYLPKKISLDFFM